MNFLWRIFFDLPRHLAMHAVNKLVERRLEPKSVRHDPSVAAGEFHATDSSSRLRVLDPTEPPQPVRVPCCLCGREIIVPSEDASARHYCAACRGKRVERPAGGAA